jgi:O-glycosyl hydrolase
MGEGSTMAVSRRIMATIGAVALLSAASCSAAGNGPAEITVEPAKTHQVMNGWEATARLWEVNKAEDRYDGSWLPLSDHIFDRLVNELGINRIRLEIKSGAENPIDYWAKFESGAIGYKEFKRHYYEKINDDPDPKRVSRSRIHFSHVDYQVENIVIPLKQRLEAKGEKLFVNFNYVDFGQTELKGNLSHARQPAEYAELIHAAFVHLKSKYGLVPDALEIILEPDNTDDWRGRQIGEAIRSVSARLKESGFSPEIIAPSTAAAGKAPAYIDEMMAVPGVPALVSTLSYHRYDRPKPRTVTAIAKRARALGVSNGLVDRLVPVPGIAERARARRLSTAMLEHLEGDAAELYEDLTVGQVSAWQQYSIAMKSFGRTPDDAGDYYIGDFADPNAPEIRISKLSRGLAHYFRYVRLGATRIEARSSDDAVKPTAFRNADGTFVVVLASHKAGPMSVRGLPAGRYVVSYTTERETARELPPIVSDGTIAVTLPAGGFMTIRQETGQKPGGRR